MMPAIDAYLAMRRAAGFELHNVEYLLRSYARFAAERSETLICTSTAINWAGQSRSVAQRDTRLKTVCRLAHYVRLEDKRHELPPSTHFAHHKSRRTPFIYSNAEIECLIDAAMQLQPTHALRPHTYATLIALLAVTGLRISEALALQRSDVTAEGLLIRETKFRKSRLVPLHDTTAHGLACYLRRRRQVTSVIDHVFVTDDGRVVSYPTVHRTFQKLLKAASLSPAPGAARPRLHDLRHRFAVTALQTCPRDRGSVSQHMLALATYMGHVNIDATYWYLQATPELLSDIAADCNAAFFEGEQP